jgi:hypothetical protein
MNGELTASAVSAAAPPAVWEVLLDGRRWSLWNSGVEWLWFEHEPAPGSPATIKFKRVRQTAVIVDDLVACQRFALRLTIGPIARLRVAWKLSQTGDGTRIDAAVTIGGIASGLLLRRPAKRLGRALPAHLERLAAHAVEQELKKNARSA